MVPLVLWRLVSSPICIGAFDGTPVRIPLRPSIAWGSGHGSAFFVVRHVVVLVCIVTLVNWFFQG